MVKPSPATSPNQPETIDQYPLLLSYINCEKNECSAKNAGEARNFGEINPKRLSGRGIRVRLRANRP
jgi:hypothetical protein